MIWNTRKIAIIALLPIKLLVCLQSFAQTPTIITINLNNKAQVIQNFGASGCWFSDPVGLYWPDSTKKRMAELLFSKQIDNSGNPKGIGLSAWRFNIGAGTAEQGDSSGIKQVYRRVECFLNADGTYNWNKEQGYLWFIKSARNYGVENLIAFANSPPVFYTKNGLGYKTTKDVYANLKADKFDAFADFLAAVLAHFDEENIRFKFISPVNEPQWPWYDKFNEATQEGSPYTNQEIYNVVKTLDRALTAKKLGTQILIPEAGRLNYLYDAPDKSQTGNEIQTFYSAASPLNLGNLKHLSRYAAAHGYYTDDTSHNTIAIRQRLADTAKKYKVDYWQSEYSMLGNGFKEGSKDANRSGFDCALFLAKLIHYDLVDGNATAWQFWNSWEPGKADVNTRYYLLALKPSADFKSGTFEVTKNLWALGHYSRFIRPGMVRISLNGLNNGNVMASAYYGNKKLVVVMINQSAVTQYTTLNLPSGKFKPNYDGYITTAANDDNMRHFVKGANELMLTLAPRSIQTLVINEK